MVLEAESYAQLTLVSVTNAKARELKSVRVAAVLLGSNAVAK
jgi:hypothetical protein